MPGQVDAHDGVAPGQNVPEEPPQACGLREAVQEDDGGARSARFDVEWHAR